MVTVPGPKATSIVNCPPANAKAPYLAELVASSWKTSAKGATISGVKSSEPPPFRIPAIPSDA